MRQSRLFACWFAALCPVATAQVVFHDEAGRALVAADANLDELAAGMQFVEGPVWLPAAKKLVFSDIPRGVLLQWTKKQGVEEFAASEQSNGNALDHEGRLLSCQHLARNVVRRETDGTLTVLADRCDGKRFNSPNDLAVHRDGTVWFTDPTYGLRGREQEQPANHVYRLDPASGDVTVVQTGFDQPNGICFAPDHRRVYIADSGKLQRIGAFAIDDDGKLGAPLFWIDGSADGMRCDQRGHLYAAARDGIRVFAADGKLLVTIPCPQPPTNCAFGGDDGRTLFVTARSVLCSIRVEVAGATLPPQPAPKPTRKEPAPPGKTGHRIASQLPLLRAGWVDREHLGVAGHR